MTPAPRTGLSRLTPGSAKPATPSPAPLKRAPPVAPLIHLRQTVGNRDTRSLLGAGLLQESLRIGPAHDVYEREADRIAGRVIAAGDRRADPTSVLPAAPASSPLQRMCSECEDELQREPQQATVAPISQVRLQRLCTECEEELDEDETLQRVESATSSVAASPALESRVSSLQGRGSPLSPAQRGFFEPRFGQDLSAVRLHTGSVAGDAARHARARAFTVGRDIVFGAGEHRPQTRSGQRLLAHELTHVIQQTPLVARRKPLLQRQPVGAEETTVPREPRPDTPGLEAEPERRPAGPEPQSQDPAQDRQRAPGLLVEDEATDLGPGQMTKSAFMAETRAAACRSADAAFAGTEHTTQGCPYIELALGFYERRSAERIERDLVSYAPEAANATSARDYIPLIAERVRQSAETYVETGEVTGLPDGLPSGIGLLGGAAALFGGLFFKAREGGPSGRPDPRAVQARLGTGRPLAGSVRSRMQSGFGRSFSGVRVHTDATASRLSDRFNARAFTVGSHVAFGSGEYRPGTPVGDALVAHELAHVVQQRGASNSVAPLQAGTAVTGALERDADRSATGVVTSLWRNTRGSASRVARNAVPTLRSGLSLQRCPSSQQVRPPQTPAQEREQAEGANQSQTPAQKQQQADEEQGPSAQEKAIDALVNDPDCQPTAIPMSQLVAIPGASLRQLGWTKLAKTGKSFKVAFDSRDDTCGIGNITEAQFNFDHLVYTEPGEHRYGNETRHSRECDKDLPLYIRVTPQAANKFKAGEVEHCKDLRRAFSLSLHKFNTAANAVKDAGRFPADNVGDCTTKLKQKISTRMGIDHDQLAGVWTCLSNKTKERDSKGWHDADVNLTTKVETDAECTKVIHELDASKILPEVGNHSTSDLVKDCGE